MAFLGKLGQTFGLGDTEQVVKSGTLAYATGDPRYLQGAFEQGGSATESAQGSNQQGTIETNQAGSEGGQEMNYGNIAGFPQIIRNFGNLISGRSGQAFGIGTGIGTGINAVGNAIFGGSQQVCQTPQSMPYGVNKMTGCITVTRKQQQRLKEMVSVVGIEQTAAAVGLNPNDLVLLLLKRFKARGRGITAASMRTTKRTIRQIKTLHNEVSSMAGRRAPVRRASTVKQVKYSN